MSVAYGIDVGATGLKIVKLEVGDGGSKLLDAAFFPTEGRPFGPEWGPRLKAFLASRGLAPKKPLVSLSSPEMVIDITSVDPAPQELLDRRVALHVIQFGQRHEEPLCHDWGLLRVPMAGRDELSALVAMGKEPYLEGIRVGLETAGIKVAGFMPASVALYNAYCKLGDVDEGITYLLDIGAKGLQLTLVAGNTLIFARGMQSGLDMFIEPLMGALEVKRARALRFLIEEGRVGAQDDVETLDFKAGRALAGATGQLAQMLSSSVKFCQVKLRLRSLEPDRYLIAGGGARMRGLADELSVAADHPAEPLDLGGVDTDALGEQARADYADGLTFGCAVGAAQVAADAGAFPIAIKTSQMESVSAFYSQTLVMIMSLVATALLLGSAWYVTQARIEAEQVRKDKVEDLANQYEQRQKDKAQLDKERNLLEQKIALLKWRVAPGARYFFTMAVIQKVMPEPMWLKDATLARPAKAENDEPVLTLTGVIEESNRNVSEIQERFIADLQGLQEVREAKLTEMVDNVKAGRTELTIEIRFNDMERPAPLPGQENK